MPHGPGYGAVGSGISTPVLFVVPGPGRERGLHQALETSAQASHGRAPVPVATTVEGDRHPANAVWRLAGQPEARRHLTELAARHS